jgi:hypothetical protein
MVDMQSYLLRLPGVYHIEPSSNELYNRIFWFIACFDRLGSKTISDLRPLMFQELSVALVTDSDTLQEPELSVADDTDPAASSLFKGLPSIGHPKQTGRCSLPSHLPAPFSIRYSQLCA